MSAKVYSRLNDEQRKVVRDILNGSDNLARSVYLRYERVLVLLDGRWTKVANFNPNDVGVRLNLAEVFARRNDGDRPSGTTWFHEFGHMIDHLSSGPGSWAEKLRAGISAEDVNLSTSYRGGIFAKTIRKEVNAYIDKRNVDMRRGSSLPSRAETSTGSRTTATSRSGRWIICASTRRGRVSHSRR